MANNVSTGLVLMSNVDEAGIPSVFVSKESGEALHSFIESSDDPNIVIDTTLRASNGEGEGDIVHFASSTGPNFQYDTLAPKLAAPGADILAAGSSLGADRWELNTGTSMSAPHVAGAAALLRSLNPDFTPLEVESALMLTATPASQLLKTSRDAPADPFDAGAGKVNVAAAAQAGFVLDETKESFESINDFEDSQQLNLVGLMHSFLLGSHKWTRQLRSTQGDTIEWTPSIKGEFLAVSVDPPVVVLDPGEITDIEIRVDWSSAPEDPNDLVFGDLIFTPNVDLPELRFPIVTAWEFDAVGFASSDFQLLEGDTVATATVFHTGPTNQPVTVSLELGDSGQLDLPQTVTIPAGQSSVSFPFTATENDQIDGDRSISLTLSATGLDSAESSIEIKDNDTILTLPGDFDGDGDVDAADRTTLTRNWTGALDPGEGNRTAEEGDADGDGDVDSADATIMTTNWTGAQMAGAQMASSLGSEREADSSDLPTHVDEVFGDDSFSVELGLSRFFLP